MNKSSKITASELVLSAIFFLQQKNGVTAKDITKFICEKRGCKQSHVRSEVKRALERATENGIFSKKRGLYRIESGFGRSRISIKVKGMNKSKKMKKSKNPSLTKESPPQETLSTPKDSPCDVPVFATASNFPSFHGMRGPLKSIQIAALGDEPMRGSSSVSRVSMERLKNQSSRNDEEEEDDDEDFFEEDEDEDDDVDYFADDQFPNTDEALNIYEEEPPKKKTPPKRKAQSRSKSRNKTKAKKRKLSKARKKSCKSRKRQPKKIPKKLDRSILTSAEKNKQEIKTEGPEDCNEMDERPDEDYEMDEDQTGRNEGHMCSDDDDDDACTEYNTEYGNDQGNEDYDYASQDGYQSGEEGQHDERIKKYDGGRGEGREKKAEEQQKEKVPVALKTTAKSAAPNPKGDGKATECGKMGTTGGGAGQTPASQEKGTSDPGNRGDKKSRRNRSSSLFRTSTDRKMVKSRK